MINTTEMSQRIKEIHNYNKRIPGRMVQVPDWSSGFKTSMSFGKVKQEIS